MLPNTPVSRGWLFSFVLKPLLLVSLIFSATPVMSEEPQITLDPVAVTVARQEIEYLRRHYARATDLIGLNTPESIAQGRTIYHRIFTPDAKITVTVDGETVFTGRGPDEWVDVAAGALSAFDNTQHLIGTQLVTIKSLPVNGKGGEATMTSYLQAWHDDPDRVLDIFIGTYHDKVRYAQSIGWQIYRMNLEKVSGEITEKG